MRSAGNLGSAKSVAFFASLDNQSDLLDLISVLVPSNQTIKGFQTAIPIQSKAIFLLASLEFKYPSTRMSPPAEGMGYDH